MQFTTKRADGYVVSKTDILVGDHVRFFTEGTVTKINGHLVHLDGKHYVDASGLGTGILTHELVKRPKPKVGDVMTPDTIRSVQWKRGTIIEYVEDGDYRPHPLRRILSAQGDWRNIDNLATGGHTFANISYSYKLIFDPAAK